jgi:hypothetical protein
MRGWALLAVFCCLQPLAAFAGSGRQTMTVVADYDYRPVCRWLEQNAAYVEESADVQILSTAGDVVTLRKQTKRGVYVFTIQRSAQPGTYSGQFVQRISGTLTAYSYLVTLVRLPERKTELTITMEAAVSDANSVAINIELRRSLRLLRTALEQYLHRRL